MREQHAVENSKNLSRRACVSQRRWTDKTQKRISLKWIILIPHYSISFLRLSLISAFPLRYYDQCKGMFHHIRSFSPLIFIFLHFILRSTSSQQKQEPCGTHPTHVWEAVLRDVWVTVSVNLFEDITWFKTNGKSGFRCYRSIRSLFFVVKKSNFLKGIFWVQCRFSSIDSTCGIMLITTIVNPICPSFIKQIYIYIKKDYSDALIVKVNGAYLKMINTIWFNSIALKQHACDFSLKTKTADNLE